MRLPISLHVLTIAACAAALVATVKTVELEGRAIDDPLARVDLALERNFTPELATREVDAALQAGDLELADSFVELSRERGTALPQEQVDRIEAMRADSWGRAARDFRDGFTHTELRSKAAISGVVAADLSGYGDLRDLAREGDKWIEGQEPDTLVLGLSAAGLALTAATWSSLGAALPARVGMSLTKALQKSGRISQPFARGLAQVTGGAVDREALQASLAAMGRLDFSAARMSGARLLRPAALRELRQVGGDVSTIYTRAGARGAQEVLAVAGSSAELRAAARIATVKGAKTRAILKASGRSVLLAGSLTLTLAGWLLTFVGWFFGVASFARRMGERIGRRIFGKARKPVVAVV